MFANAPPELPKFDLTLCLGVGCNYVCKGANHNYTMVMNMGNHLRNTSKPSIPGLIAMDDLRKCTLVCWCMPHRHKKELGISFAGGGLPLINP